MKLDRSRIKLAGASARKSSARAARIVGADDATPSALAPLRSILGSQALVSATNAQTIRATVSITYVSLTAVRSSNQFVYIYKLTGRV